MDERMNESTITSLLKYIVYFSGQIVERHFIERKVPIFVLIAVVTLTGIAVTVASNVAQPHIAASLPSIFTLYEVL
jgi:hypothetical protein